MNEVSPDFTIKCKVFFMMHNKVCEAQCISITTVETEFGFKKNITVDKNPAGSQYTVTFNTSEIFTTKDALLKSL